MRSLHRWASASFVVLLFESPSCHSFVGKPKVAPYKTYYSLSLKTTETSRLEDYRVDHNYIGSNLLYTNDAEQEAFAREVVTSEIAAGRAEFFVGSGVGREVTGMNWVRLVNKGADCVLETEGVETHQEEGSKSFELLTKCRAALDPDTRSKEAQNEILASHEDMHDWVDMVKAYANAVDICLYEGYQAGLPCPQSYNLFLAHFFEECHKKESCPTKVSRTIAKAIAAQLKKQTDRTHAVYTTNYNRAINFALLELGVQIEEVYPVRWEANEHTRNCTDYGEDVELIRSVLSPSVPQIGRVVVFHLHGIAKEAAEFSDPLRPGPSPRSIWASQKHYSLGKAASFIQDGISPSFAKPVMTTSFRAKSILDIDACSTPLDTSSIAKEMYAATAEGILITNAQYNCKEHVECLKGTLRVAMQDTERTIIMVGSSLGDTFFEKFIYGEDVSHDEIQHGISVQIQPGGDVPNKFLAEGSSEATDVDHRIKPHLLFILALQGDGKKDFNGPQEFLESCICAM